MSEAEHLAEVQRWLRYAQEDLIAAESLIGQRTIAPRHVCWLAQQAAETVLKAVLVLHIDFPRRHDLDALRNPIPVNWPPKEEHPDLADLTEWAVGARYPGGWPDATEEDARSTVQQARAVWQSVCRDLAGLPARLNVVLERE
jgi:HEPN domain-containing protein